MFADFLHVVLHRKILGAWRLCVGTKYQISCDEQEVEFVVEMLIEALCVLLE